MMAESENQTRPQKEMSTSVKATNIVMLLVLLGVSAYIIYRVVDDVSIVLFTYHPTFHVLGVRILQNSWHHMLMSKLKNVMLICYSFTVPNIDVKCDSNHGWQQFLDNEFFAPKACHCTLDCSGERQKKKLSIHALEFLISLNAFYNRKYFFLSRN